jgi:hypothetical protein
MSIQFTEADLDLLIFEKLDTEEECSVYPNLCQFMQTEEGKSRVFTRIKEIILNDGITDIDTAIANVETELIFTTENDSQ